MALDAGKEGANPPLDCRRNRRLDSKLMEIALIVTAWMIGLASAVGMTVGVIEAVTGRMIVGHSDWSAGEVKVRGLAWVISSFVLTIYGLLGVIVLSTGERPNWVAPDWWHYMEFASWPVILFGFPTTMFLLERHNKRRWPFNGKVQQRSRWGS